MITKTENKHTLTQHFLTGTLITLLFTIFFYDIWQFIHNKTAVSILMWIFSLIILVPLFIILMIIIGKFTKDLYDHSYHKIN